MSELSNDQADIIAFLLRAESYPDSQHKVEQITTHISHIFLVGDLAFKLKRAIKYSYLDYSTLAARESFVKAELELNRRTAPGMYLAAHAITRTESGFEFDGKGEVADWVLEMRRFAAEDLFDRMAEEHQLTPGISRDLADVIAEFHARAEIVRAHGGSAGIKETIRINDENLKLAAPPLDRARIDELRARSGTLLGQLAHLLGQRKQDGKVRRGHGDLHLGNICLFEGKATLFDCIDFNDEFSCIDVLYDLAFLLMDLIERELPDHANLIFNRYLDRTDEAGGLAALPLFLSLRAAVRAHVLGGVAKSDALSKKAKEALVRARTYLKLANDLLEMPPPSLIAVAGFSGTGKSTVAYSLAPALGPAPGARVIRSDVVRKRLMKAAPETRLPESAYTREANQAVYDAVYDEIKRALEAGYTAIADAAFLRDSERAAIADLAKESNVPFAGLWLEAPSEVLITRIAARRNDASDADRAVLERQLGYDLGAMDWRRVDVSGDPQNSARNAARELRIAIRNLKFRE